LKSEDESHCEAVNVAVSGQNQAAANPCSNAGPAANPAMQEASFRSIVVRRITRNAGDGGNQANSVNQQENDHRENSQQ